MNEGGKKSQFMSVRLYNQFNRIHPMILEEQDVGHGMIAAKNIIDHTYNCWLMSLLLLPSASKDTYYSKEKIQEIILIHDFGKSMFTERISEKQEDEEMRMFFLRGAYPEMPNLTTQYDLWTEWKEQETINARIAKEIDEIQIIYQLCTHVLTRNCNDLTAKEISGMKHAEKSLTTEIGKEIFQRIIISNDKFANINFDFLKTYIN